MPTEGLRSDAWSPFDFLRDADVMSRVRVQSAFLSTALRGVDFGPGGAGGIPSSRAIARMCEALNGDKPATSVGVTPARSAATTARRRPSLARASAVTASW